MKKKYPRLQRLRVNLIKLQRKQRGDDYSLPLETGSNTCKNCGHPYTGRYCPQCGLSAGWQRFSAKQLLTGFLDIWGMGNRPMMRSIRDLIWRPGYMMRDYLNGHHLNYFPPFKMLAILVIFEAAVIWITGTKVDLEEDDLLQFITKEMVDDGSITTAMADKAHRIWAFFMDNVLYSLLIQNVLLVVIVHFAYRKQGYNLVETFFMLIYVNCQMQLITIAQVLLTHTFDDTGLYPYAVPDIMCPILLIYDFAQFYRMKLWPTFKRYILITLLLLLFYAFFIISIAITLEALG